MTDAALYAYQQVIAIVAPGSFAMSVFWYKFANNAIYACELAFIIVYALLRRRAKADVVRWRQDVEGWFTKAGDMRRDARKIVRGDEKPPDED